MTDDLQPVSDPDKPHLICAYLLDGKGHGKELDGIALGKWKPEDGTLWAHFDALNELTEVWLSEHASLDPLIVDSLLTKETRPRCEPHGDGVLVILRGVNLNPNADPEDMVSIRLWVDGHRILSTRLRPLMAIEDIRAQIGIGKGPGSSGHFVARLAWQLAERMGPVIQGLSDQMAEIEDNLDNANTHQKVELRDIRHPLLDLRRTTITLRRYLAPQRDAISTMSLLDEEWIDTRTKNRFREVMDRLSRITEELDEIRERSLVVQDELANRISHRMEKTMYVLTIVATVMLPLGLATGLLGINVGGIPGAETSWAFWVVCLGLLGIAGMEVWIFRRLGWL